MANTHITIPTSTRLGGQIQQLIDSTREANMIANKLAAVLTTYGGAYDAMAIDIGFTGANATANMTTVFGLLAAGYTNGLNQTDLVAMINKLG